MGKKYCIRRKACLLLACALFLLSCLNLPVEARTMVNTEEKGSITIQYQVPNAEFSLYKVAQVTDNYDFIVTEEFAGYKIDFNSLDTEQWKNVAETLAAYVERDKLEPLFRDVTDQNGMLVFDDLSVGVYLVIGKQVQDEDYIYRSKPFLAFVPQENEDGSWNYHPELYPKPSDDPIEHKDYTVIKIWKDEGMEQERPNEIQVELLRDGEVYETVVLNQDNNWKYTWEDLSSEYNWQVVEKEVLGDYTVSISQEGTVFEIVNTLEGEVVILDELPQTGQLWWPVPVLAVAGMFFFVVGWIKRRTANEY